MARSLKLHPHQGTIYKSRARFRVVCCGRRFGKTTVGKLALLDRAVAGGRCWWLSPTYQMAGQVWRDLKATVAHHAATQVSESERRIDFPGGGMLAIRSTHTPDNLRGAGLDLAVLDEAAFMAPGVWPEVIRPMLLERAGAALFLSSPNGRNGFWALYRRGRDRADGDWRAFHFTSYDNPHIPRAEFDAIRRSTPERIWREEYLAEFIDDAGRVFRRLYAAATAPPDAQPVAGRLYIGGIDWGRELDFTVIVIIDAETRQMVALDRFNEIGWALQRGRVSVLYERWRPAVLWAERNSIGDVNIEALQNDGLPVRPFLTTALSKAPLVEALALALERGELALLPDVVLLGELAAYTFERLPGGGRRYSAPPGGHDDTVIATALAWYGVQHGGITISFA